MSEKVFDLIVDAITGQVTEIEVSAEELAERELAGAEEVARLLAATQPSE